MIGRGICTWTASAWESGAAGKDHGIDSGMPRPGIPGRCMHEGYTDIILNADTEVK